MSETERPEEETAEEREQTMKDLDVPEEESRDVTGGINAQKIDLGG